MPEPSEAGGILLAHSASCGNAVRKHERAREAGGIILLQEDIINPGINRRRRYQGMSLLVPNTITNALALLNAA